MLRELGVSVMLLVASTGVVVSEDAPTGFGAPRSLGVPKAATSDAARSNKSDVPQAPVAPPRPGPRETTRSAAVPDRGKHLPIVMGYQLGAKFDDARAAAAVGVFHLRAEFAGAEIEFGADAGLAER